MVHLYNRVLSHIERKENKWGRGETGTCMEFEVKWMEEEKIIPNEILKTQKDKYGMYLLTCGYHLLIHSSLSYHHRPECRYGVTVGCRTVTDGLGPRDWSRRRK